LMGGSILVTKFSKTVWLEYLPMEETDDQAEKVPGIGASDPPTKRVQRPDKHMNGQ